MGTPQSIFAAGADALFHHGAPTQLDYVPDATVYAPGTWIEPGIILQHGTIPVVTNRRLDVVPIVTSKESDADYNLVAAVKVATRAVASGGVWLVSNPDDTIFAAGDQVEWEDTLKKAVIATAGDFDLGLCEVVNVAGQLYVAVQFYVPGLV